MTFISFLTIILVALVLGCLAAALVSQPKVAMAHARPAAAHAKQKSTKQKKRRGR